MDVRTKTFPIETERLTLRLWRDEDREPFAAMCADPRVMEFLTQLPTRTESDAYIDRLIAHHQQYGFGFWVMEERSTGTFAGVTGLRHFSYDTHFSPAVEFGWRMPIFYWGRGLATEAASACIDYAFGPLGFSEIVAITVAANCRSRAVMERIGMTYDPADNFIHPALPPDDPFQPLVLYRKAAPKISTEEIS